MSQTSTSINPETSPLKEVSPRAIEKIFSSAVDTITDEELDLAILELRKNRESFQLSKQTKTKGVSTPLGSVDDIFASLTGDL